MDEINETYEQMELLIGKENAQKVIDFFKGSSIYFPKSIGLAALHEQIYGELQDGATYKTLARKYGYTKSYIRRIEKKMREARKAARAGGAAKRPVTAAQNENTAKLKPRDIKPFEQGELFYE